MLTVAQFFRIYTVLDPENYRVFAGALDLTNDTSADRHRNVERFTIHPDYRPESPYANDIAVITVSVIFTSYVLLLGKGEVPPHLFP